MRSKLPLAFAGLALITACDSSTHDDGSMSIGSTALPCDVDKVFADHCRSCHGKETSFGAPMSLVTYEDLTAPAVTDSSKKVYEMVEERIHDTKTPMPQPPNKALDAEELATIDAWVKAEAPKGDASCGTGGAGSGGAGGNTATTIDCTPDIHLAPTSAWEMPKDDTDLYVCYGIDVPAGDRKNVIGFVPHIDNTKIVHHVLLYQSDDAVSATPAPCDGSVSVTGKKLIYAWAPGGTAFKMPDEAGFPMDATNHYYIQIHYNNIQGLEGEKDSSGFDLCSTSETRPNVADMVAFGTINITLPPNETTSRDCTYTWPDAAGEVHAIAAFPHMHKLGTSIFTKQNPTGAANDLGKNDPWNFNNQPFIPIKGDIKPGDVIETKCTWDNTTAATVNFGEYTEDEMCFSFTMYYPAAANFKTWLAPSAKSKCQ